MANTKVTSRVIADDAVTTAAIADDAITAALIADNAVGVAALSASNPSNGQALTYVASSNDLQWATISGGVAGISSSADATAITITSNENVGIGITDPDSYVTDAGSLAISGQIRVQGVTNSASVPIIGLRDNNSGFFAPADNAIGFSTAATERLRLDTNGNLIHEYGSYKVGDPDSESENFGTVANNTVNTAYSNIDSNITNNGVYWLNYNSKKFRAYVRVNWMQGRNWVLAAKFYNFNDMTSGNPLWENDTSHNEGDFDIYSGNWSKYGQVWRYFSFNRLAMQMGDRVAPIMQFNSNQTLYGAFSGGRAANGGGVTADSTDPQIADNATYHNMSPKIGPTFTDLGGAEEVMQSYGLNKWAAASTNSTSANNQSTRSKTGTVKGHQLTVEESHATVSGLSSEGYAGAWIGCPLDNQAFTFGGDTSNAGADSGFGLGGGCGNSARTWTSGIAEWARGSEVANYLPAYIWLSID
tara:strand:- start:931 stop:2349 length:1419 start_codon:yes stop_codon:yes gene_type:complete